MEQDEIMNYFLMFIDEGILIYLSNTYSIIMVFVSFLIN